MRVYFDEDWGKLKDVDEDGLIEYDVVRWDVIPWMVNGVITKRWQFEYYDFVTVAIKLG